jgi:hypothetical protein
MILRENPRPLVILQRLNLALAVYWCLTTNSCASRIRCDCAVPTDACAKSVASNPTGQELRAALQKARAATGERVLFTGGWQQPSSLVGRSKGEMRALLGQPDYLADSRGILPAGFCDSPRDWVYILYHLPPSLGGRGPELHIRFGSNGLASDAWWVGVPREGAAPPPPFQLEPEWQSVGPL